MIVKHMYNEGVSCCVWQAEELVKRLADLEHSASSDAAVREKIAALPPEVSDINHLSKITGR